MLSINAHAILSDCKKMFNTIKDTDEQHVTIAKKKGNTI